MPNQVKVTISGDAAFKRKLKQLGPAALNVATGSLYRSAEKVMAKSRNLVPVDTGALRSTGHVEVLNDFKTRATFVELGYGSVAVDYAVPVHEINKNYHGGRQWKYLQQPMEEAIPDINRALKTDIDDALDSL